MSEVIDNILNSKDLQDCLVANSDNFCDKACCISLNYTFERRTCLFRNDIAAKISRLLDVLPGIDAHTKVVHFYHPEDNKFDIFDDETQRNVSLASLHSKMGSTKFAFGFNESLKFKKDYQRLVYNLCKVAKMEDLDKIEFINKGYILPINHLDVKVMSYDAGFEKAYSIIERNMIFGLRDKATERLINMLRR